MQIDSKTFLDLAERSDSICFFDIESFNLKGDYGSIICVSIKPYKKEPFTHMIEQIGNDRKVVREAVESLSKYKLWISFYGKMFDVKLLNTRLLKWRMNPLPKTHHLDMYYLVKQNLLTSRRSMAHLNSWLETKTQKDSISADTWVKMMRNEEGARRDMLRRCESDCTNLEELYDATKHLVGEITR